jgi:hypothetical protein
VPPPQNIAGTLQIHMSMIYILSIRGLYLAAAAGHWAARVPCELESAAGDVWGGGGQKPSLA